MVGFEGWKKVSILWLSCGRVPEVSSKMAEGSKQHSSQTDRRYCETEGKGGSKSMGR